MASKKKHKAFVVITVAVAVITIVVALYIMFHGLGLVEGLDFGAGSYYYADIPDFEKYVDPDAYRSHLPLWLAIVLFLAWGWLMFQLWKWVDKH